ncbi:hypothetical protein BDZ45DRAFT_740928 [Acephala macrosclerotiorum]|nr:hypothetical protein BDZ45DRAFT_740928 [Acephala macrosclerotiorum]
MKTEENLRTSIEDNNAERPLNSSEIGRVQDTVEPIAELYLFERPCGKDAEDQLLTKLDALFADIPRKDLESFLEGHSKDAVSQIGTYAMEVITGEEKTLENLKPFFAKWSRHVTQTKDHWKVERMIRAKNPYDVDTTFGDPREKRIPHTRYSRFPENCRGYYLISEIADEINHALKECVSVFSKTVGQVYKCALLFDPLQYQDATRYRPHLKDISDKKETFKHVERGRDRFVRCFKEKEKASLLTQPDIIETEIRELLVDFILRDEALVMSQLSNSLDTLELSLGNDKQLSDTLPIWRGFFGEERNRLFHQGVMLDYIRRMLDIPRGDTRNHPAEASSSSSSSEKNFSKKMEIVETSRQSLDRRMGGTYQALMSTMSIIESDRAVKEAEAVTKLTNLAFFFIPLSLVATTLAMPLKEFQNSDGLKVWLWVTVSLSVMTITYSILYWKKVIKFIQAATKYLKSFNMDKLKTLMVNLAFAGIYFFLFLIFLGILAVSGIGVWKIKMSHLSGAAKGGLSYLVVSAALGFVFAFLACCCVVR